MDQIATNRIALRAKLGAAQFDVAQAMTVSEALEAVARDKPDLILSGSVLPDGSAKDLLKKLDAQIGLRRPPVLVCCARNDGDERLSFLRAGADDVVTTPMDDLVLLARIRTLVRAAYSEAELQLRDDTSRALCVAEDAAQFERHSKVSLIGMDEVFLRRLSTDLSDTLEGCNIAVTPIADLTLPNTPADPADAYVLLFHQGGVPDMLRLLSTLRSHRTSRNAAILVLQDQPDTELAAYALDMGASDLVMRDVSTDEISLRLAAMLRRKRQGDQLRATVETGLQAAVCDPLTGLHNRRYALPHLQRMVERAAQTHKPVGVMLADMDHFKRINDSYGHAAGDAVLIETADRLRQNLRAVDLVSRIGGEEFLIVLPGVSLQNAQRAAERICQTIHDTPYTVPQTREFLDVTISIGLTVFDPNARFQGSVGLPSPQSLINQADAALYQAKERGRNRVRLSPRPAA